MILSRGDSVYVDTGMYAETNSIEIGVDDSGLGTNYVVIQGNTNAMPLTVFSRPVSKDGFYLNNAVRVMLRDMLITNGQYGVYLQSSDSCLFSNMYSVGSAKSGLYIDGNTNTIANCETWDGVKDGIYIDGNDVTVSQCASWNNADNGINAQNADSTLITHCRTWNNRGSGVELKGDSNRVEYSVMVYNTNDQLALAGGAGRGLITISS